MDRGRLLTASRLPRRARQSRSFARLGDPGCTAPSRALRRADRVSDEHNPRLHKCTIHTHVIYRYVEEALDLARVEVHRLRRSAQTQDAARKSTFPPAPLTMTWSQPASLSMFATSLAVIGARDLSFLSCRA